MKNDYILALVFILIAFLIRIPNLSYPPQPIFDEIYFTNFGIKTLNGETDIDVHPPFIRMIFADIIKVSGFSDLSKKINLSEDYGNFPYKNLRLMTAVAGSLIVGIIFLLAKKMYSNTMLASLPALLIIFDGALVSYSRAILYDIYLLLFGFLGILFLVYATDSLKKINIILFYILAGVSFGLTASVKWSGFGFLASGLILLISRGKIKYFLPVAIIAFVTYFGVFLSLYGSDNIDRFFQVQQKMFFGHLSVSDYHPAQSPPWKWPLAIDTFILWGNGKDDIIRLSPNVFSWSAAFVSIFLAFYIFMRDKTGNLFFLLGSYLANFLPFFLISRPMFLYHYFPALIFSYLMIPWAFKYLSELLFGQINNRHIYAIIAVNILFFAIFIPFIY